MINTHAVTDVEWSGIDHKDHPDYCDAFIEKATYEDREMTEDEIEELMDNNPEWCYDNLMDWIH